MKTIIAIALAALLAGCAHAPQLAASPSVPHHVRKATPIVPPPVVVAPPVVAPAPQVSPKQTFKRRWLRLFFRDRATK